MNLLDSLDPEQARRALAAQIAANAAGDNTGISTVLRMAQQIEVYIRTGSTNGR